MRLITLALLLSLCNCGKHQCRGIYTTTDSNGNLTKFNERLQADQGRCSIIPMELSNWERTLQAKQKANTPCVPQAMTKTLIAGNNFYNYRDGKVLLDLSASGEYKRIFYGEHYIDGSKIFSRQVGCFFVRDNQLLLPSENSASTDTFRPDEIFTVTNTGSSTNMVRWDNSGDWAANFCPYQSTPWNFCTALRNGNIMFDPTLTAADSTDLLSQALLIRKIYQYIDLSKASFDTAWNNVESYGAELPTTASKYIVVPLPDLPPYTYEAWEDYVKGDRPVMPDVSSSNIVSPICYPGSKDVILADGSKGKVHGEICYANGSYTFTGSP